MSTPQARRNLLHRVQARYAELAAYADSGIVVAFDPGDPGSGGAIAHTSTRFVRPDVLEFAYAQSSRQTSVGGGGTAFAATCEISFAHTLQRAVCHRDYSLGARRFRDDLLAGALKPATLSDALLDVGQTTRGASCLIPRLLLPSLVRGRPITDLDALCESDLFDMGPGPDGTVLVCGEQGAFTVGLWIEPDSCVIRRVARSLPTRDGVTSVDYVVHR